MEVRGFTVGPVQENTFIVRQDGAGEALIVDPGDESQRLLDALDELGVKLVAILITHTHFDHIGAVADLAEATGAPVWCPELELQMMREPGKYMPAMFGPFRGWEPEHSVSGGERLELAGFDIDVHFTPGHSIGHVSYSIPDEQALFSGDVLFRDSVGRVDLPGGDWPTLERSIGALLDSHADETQVFPGHMELTTLGRERAQNPFLAQLAGR
jgi:glyoxylase-like metal-dependent hydrolase (beta-lactamase superfamily II)